MIRLANDVTIGLAGCRSHKNLLGLAAFKLTPGSFCVQMFKAEPICLINRLYCQNAKLNIIRPRAVSQPRPMSTFIQTQTSFRPSLKEKISKYFRYHLIDKVRLKSSGPQIFIQLQDNVDIFHFFQVCRLPDTLNSYYLVIQLHIWLLCVRLMAEGRDGLLARNSLIEALYVDIDERSKKLGGYNPSSRKEQVMLLQYAVTPSLLTYDQALEGSDQNLASALWLTFFEKNCDDPEVIECCVHYVRRNLVELEKVDFQSLIRGGKFKFLPLLKPEKIRALVS